MRVFVHVAACVLVSLGSIATGCATAGGTSPGRAAPGIQHVVLIKLRDPAQAPRLLADGEALRRIPGVRRYVSGRPVGAGRAAVDAGYDVGVTMDFASAADLERYLADPRHVALVEKWAPRWEWIRIHDFGAPAP